MMSSIYDQQRDAFRKFGKIINSKSFRISTRERQNVFRDVESVNLHRYVYTHPVPDVGYTCKDLREQVQKTVKVLRHNIEVAEESDSKAIRVFTIVTIVFLPLSFVASVFGMNTTDIRNMGSSQGLFWAIAIPVTAIIGGVSLIIAYHGTHIWDRARAMGNDARLKAAAEKSRLSALSSHGRMHKAADEERVDEEGILDRLPQRRTATGRKRQRTGFTLDKPKNSGLNRFSHKKSMSRRFI